METKKIYFRFFNNDYIDRIFLVNSIPYFDPNLKNTRLYCVQVSVNRFGGFLDIINCYQFKKIILKYNDFIVKTRAFLFTIITTTLHTCGRLYSVCIIKKTAK